MAAQARPLEKVQPLAASDIVLYLLEGRIAVIGEITRRHDSPLSSGPAGELVVANRSVAAIASGPEKACSQVSAYMSPPFPRLEFPPVATDTYMIRRQRRHAVGMVSGSVSRPQRGITGQA